MSNPPRTAFQAADLSSDRHALAEALTQIDHIRAEMQHLREQLAAAHRATALEKFRRLTLVINAAVAANDRATWAKAVAERMQLGVDAWADYAETEAA
jgi:uncharacterized coiled-coil protein SlyX